MISHNLLDLPYNKNNFIINKLYYVKSYLWAILVWSTRWGVVRANFGMQLLTVWMVSPEIRVIVRDSLGEILACLCSTEYLFTSPLVAEAAALRRAMLFCTELGTERCSHWGRFSVIIQATKSKKALYIDYSRAGEDI